MLHQHKSRITSTHTAVLKHLGDIRQIVVAGKSPAGAPLAPLPEPIRSQLLAALDSIAAGIDGLVDAFAPEALQPAESSDTTATLRWITVLLRTITDLTKDLSPERLESRYGELGPGEAGQLAQRVEVALSAVRKAGQALSIQGR